MIRYLRTLSSAQFREIGIFLVILLCGVLVYAGEAFAQEEISPKVILGDEIDRMLNRTLPEEFSENSRGLLERKIKGYRRALRQLRAGLKSESDRDRTELFDQFENVLEAGVALREKQHDDRDDRLDQLREELEERKKLAEDEGDRLRAEWIENYDRHLRLNDDLQRHQGVLIRTFGVFASGFVSSEKIHRFESSLWMVERIFPYVLQELFETDAPSNHFTRLYVKLLGLLESRRNDLENSVIHDRFQDHVRRSGGTILRLDRIGVIQSVPGDLEKTIRRLLKNEDG